jgi:hypothetical protein
MNYHGVADHYRVAVLHYLLNLGERSKPDEY